MNTLNTTGRLSGKILRVVFLKRERVVVVAFVSFEMCH
jgi:hypothetical protein